MIYQDCTWRPIVRMDIGDGWIGIDGEGCSSADDKADGKMTSRTENLRLFIPIATRVTRVSRSVSRVFFSNSSSVKSCSGGFLTRLSRSDLQNFSISAINTVIHVQRLNFTRLFGEF
jgi:hypothetical protein